MSGDQEVRVPVPIADHIIVVARSVDHDPASKHGNVALVAVPTAQVSVRTPYRKVGAGPLDTAAVHIDTWVPADALVARAGTGLAAISWGWPMSACRSPGRSRRRASARSGSPWPA